MTFRIYRIQRDPFSGFYFFELSKQIAFFLTPIAKLFFFENCFNHFFEMFSFNGVVFNKIGRAALSASAIGKNKIMHFENKLAKNKNVRYILK